MSRKKNKEEYPEMNCPEMPGMMPGMHPGMMPGMHPGMMPGMTMQCYCVPVPCPMQGCGGMRPPMPPAMPQNPCMDYPMMPVLPTPHNPCADQPWGMVPAMPAEYPMIEDIEED